MSDAALRTYSQRSWLDPRVEVRPSPIDGFGLFARLPIAAGEPVIVMGGRVLSDEEFRRVSRDLSRYSAATIADGLNLLLEDDTPVRFGNHSCDANLWLGDEVTLIVRQAIPADAELTVDYATHTADKVWQMACRCGTAACRGVITHDDWRRADVQERYAGHFSPFLNARIARLRAAI